MNQTTWIKPKTKKIWVDKSGPQRKGGGGRGRAALSTPPFPGEKKNCYVKSENITFLHVNKIWYFSFFIEQDTSDKK